MNTYQIEIESKGDYTMQKRFNHQCTLTDREYLRLSEIILDFLEEVKVTRAKDKLSKHD